MVPASIVVLRHWDSKPHQPPLPIYRITSTIWNSKWFFQHKREHISLSNIKVKKSTSNGLMYLGGHWCFFINLLRILKTALTSKYYSISYKHAQRGGRVVPKKCTTITNILKSISVTCFFLLVYYTHTWFIVNPHPQPSSYSYKRLCNLS